MPRFATALDLSQLAAPDVVDRLDYEAIRAALIADFKTRVPDYDVEMLESDPAVKLLEVAAYRELIIRALINDKARALLLAAAKHADLDQLGVYYGVARVVITPATGIAAAVMEGDEALRRRIQLAPEAFSTAGPPGAYEFHALSADPVIKSVGVYAHGESELRPGEVRIYLLARAGDGTAAPALIEKVTAYLKAGGDKLPATDMVAVLPAQVVSYQVHAVLSLPPGPDPLIVRQKAEAALAAYTASRHIVGAGVPLSGLSRAAFADGVEAVTIITPAADIMGAMGVAPFCSGIQVSTRILS
jgi:phage-related baseplate assembly protein